MRIPNKFNGYSADNIRLYYDPVTLAALATTAGTAGTAAAGTAAATTALGSGIAAGTALAGGATAAAGLGAAGAAGAGLASAAAPSALAAAAPSALQSAGLQAAKQSAITNAMGSAGTNLAGSAGSNLASTMGANMPTTWGNAATQSLAQQAGAGGSNLASTMGANMPTTWGNAATQNLAQQAGAGGIEAAQPLANSATSLTESIRNANTTLNGPAQISYAPNAQGLSANAAPGANAATTPSSSVVQGKGWWENAKNLASDPSMQGLKDYASQHPYATSAAVGLGANALFSKKPKRPEQDKGMVRPYELDRDAASVGSEAYSGSTPAGINDSSERRYFADTWTALEPYKAAGGGLASVQHYQAGGVAGGFPTGQQHTNAYASDNAIPTSMNFSMSNDGASSVGPAVGQFSGEPIERAGGGLASHYANGGATHYNLGGYSDGGRLLKGPGDGVSDSIPASIGDRQPARLADGEFVVPARIVSELGNGSTEAGARQLYKMMERVQSARKKSIGKGKVAVNSKASKHLPA